MSNEILAMHTIAAPIAMGTAMLTQLSDAASSLLGGRCRTAPFWTLAAALLEENRSLRAVA